MGPRAQVSPVFAVGTFALLYLVGQALVYAAEVAAVRYARLRPRALDLNRPTEADARALTLLAREQERIPASSSSSTSPGEAPRRYRAGLLGGAGIGMAAGGVTFLAAGTLLTGHVGPLRPSKE